MRSNSGSNLKSAVNAIEGPRDGWQLTLPFEVRLANDDGPLDDPFETCRWEDDGGALRKEGTHGE
jgi:hypothetical protein